MRIGLFGGSFDPIHNGHLHIARAFADEIGLNQVLFLPAGLPYHKHATASTAKHRLAMVELAIQSDVRFGVSDCDIVRQGQTYTADTIQIFRQHFPQAQLWWLMGMDSLFSLHTWKNWSYITQHCHLAVAPREGKQLQQLPPALHQWAGSALQNGSLRFLNTPLLNISSTQLRQNLKHQQDCRGDLPQTVLDYIKQHALYQ